MALVYQLRVTLLSAFAVAASSGIARANDAKPQITQEEKAKPDTAAGFSVVVDILPTKKGASAVCVFIISPDQPDKAVTGQTDGQNIEFNFPNAESISAVLPSAQMPQGSSQFTWRAASGIVNLPVFGVPELLERASDAIITQCKHTLHI